MIQSNTNGKRISVAPMMDWTDRYYRYFMRGITRKAWLYTEMIPTATILLGDRHHYLDFDPMEGPLAIQLGGSHPEELAECARIATDYGYDEINLNVGCPSDKVIRGQFGASLMRQPELVADCVSKMKGATHLPVTVKCRIGIDEQDSDEFLWRFVEIVSQGGCNRFIVHARIALLHGISPKANRSIPPLQYDRVERLKQSFPELAIEINGGIANLDEALQIARNLDGAMLGRAAYENPWVFAGCDRLLQDQSRPKAHRQAVLDHCIRKMEQMIAGKIPLRHFARHILGLFHGCPGARRWRQILSDHNRLRNCTRADELIREASSGIPQDYLMATSGTQHLK